MIQQCRIILDIGDAKKRNKNPSRWAASTGSWKGTSSSRPIGSSRISFNPCRSYSQPQCPYPVTRSFCKRVMDPEWPVLQPQDTPTRPIHHPTTAWTIRKATHPPPPPPSGKSKAPLAKYCLSCPIPVVDLVYLYSDRNKSRARDRYLVVAVNSAFCNKRKFAGSQFRRTAYRLKTFECYQVPSEVPRKCFRVIQWWKFTSFANTFPAFSFLYT